MESFDRIFYELKEREKELTCLYRIHKLLNDPGKKEEEIFLAISEIIPSGWQYPENCFAELIIENNNFRTNGFIPSRKFQKSVIRVFDEYTGEINVYYSQVKGIENRDFLPEEQHLLNTISDMLAGFIFSSRLGNTIAFLKIPMSGNVYHEAFKNILIPTSSGHSEWRKNMVDLIAKRIQVDRFGIKNIYLIGSVKNMTCGPASDIDILIHYDGNPENEKTLRTWFEGWSLCLAELNNIRTGLTLDGLIDLHFITDEDINNKNSFASMINAVTDGAKKII